MPQRRAHPLWSLLVDGMKNSTLDSQANSDLTEQIIAKLWPKNKSAQNRHVFAILDGARDKQIHTMVSNSKRPHCCLYLEPLTDKLRAAAPYLIELDESYARMLIQKSWGAHWGIYLSSSSSVSITKIRHQYRKINCVIGPEGKRLFFRYYDPRVLRAYLPTCHQDELNYFFGLITDILMEGDTAHSLLHFHHSPQESKWENFQLT